MKLVIINGPSCSGKSTIVKGLLEGRERAFKLSYDGIKWFFSGYDYKKHAADALEVLFAVAESVFKMKYDVISDSGLKRDFRERQINAALREGYDIIEVNLEADFDVLLERFDQRVASALAMPEKKISNTSRDRFKELHDVFQENKNPDAITFRTDRQSPEEIIAEITKLMA